MLVEVVNKMSNKRIAVANIIFGLDNFIILDVDGMDIDELEDILSKKIDIKNYNYNNDNEILKFLNLQNRSFQFGHMSEAYCLYMLLNYFNTEDEYLVYPLQNEIVSMIDLDVRYSNIYMLKKRGQVNVVNA